MNELVIQTDKPRGIADLVFAPNADDRDLLDDLHQNVLTVVDGASMKSGIDDSVVAIRDHDFDAVVSRIADHYSARGFAVSVVPVG